MKKKSLQVIAGTANQSLAAKICDYLYLSPAEAEVERFPDGEWNVKLNSDIRDTDVFIIQPTCPPVNDSIMELLLLIDCCRRASAHQITAVIPYFGYARKDRKDEGRVPISAKLVSNMIVSAGAQRVLTLDLHATQIQGFFDIPVDHLYAAPVFIKYFQEKGIKDLTVVSPDVGRTKLARVYAQNLGGELAVVDKVRTGPDQVAAGTVIGDVKGRNVILPDDMISTGGSIVLAANVVMELGAKSVHVCATHGILCGDSIQRLNDAPIQEVVVSDSVPMEGLPAGANIKTLTVARLLGEAIRRIHEGESVSALFET